MKTRSIILMCLIAVLAACAGKTSGEDYLGMWQNTENDVARIEIRDEGGQYFVKLLNTRGGDIEFPAAFDVGSRQLNFRFSGFLGDADATSYLRGDTLHINAEGRTQQFTRIKE
jgi:hypothetical protein